MFDVIQRRRAIERSFKSSDDSLFLIKHAFTDILDRLSVTKKVFDDALVLNARGCTDSIASLSQSGKIKTISSAENTDIQAISQDISPLSYDLIISVFDLHAENDVPEFLKNIYRMLRPDGLFMAAFPGDETLRDLRTSLMQAELSMTGGAAPRIYPMIDMRDAAQLMQRAGFALPVVDKDRVIVSYPSLIKLMHDLRGIGETNALSARSRNIPHRTLFERAEGAYRASCNDNIDAIFDIIHLSGWKS
jgi:SAM-dependent methyltransferase